MIRRTDAQVAGLFEVSTGSAMAVMVAPGWIRISWICATPSWGGDDSI
jgi:hypothetical protein